MRLDEMWAQLESDLEWRQDELRLLSNSIASVLCAADQDRVRRAQIVMLYAHTEGFAKVALSIYIRAINDLCLDGKILSANLVASSFADVFHAVTHGDPKEKVFNDPLPEDSGLHPFCRQRDFISKAEELLERHVKIPLEAVDTESNLNSRVLHRNLYRLGLPSDAFEQYESELDELVHRRNNIAHGTDFDPIRKDVYERIQRAVFQFMDELTLSLTYSMETSSYLRALPANS